MHKRKSLSSSPDNYKPQSEINKKIKIMDVDNLSNQKVDPVLIQNIDTELANDPVKLKAALNNQFPEIKNIETRITFKGDLIIYVESFEELETILQDTELFGQNKKVVLSKKIPKYEIVVKGLSYENALSNLETIKNLGISEIHKFATKKLNYKIFKATCNDVNSRNKLINEGLKILYTVFPVEEYLKPIKPTQCFKCQKYGHIAIKCTSKEATCVKCSGRHKLSDYKEAEIKCGNCGENHTSSYGGCKEYKVALEKHIENFNKKNTKIQMNRQYSDVVKNKQLNNLSINETKMDLMLRKQDEILSSINSMQTNIQQLHDSVNKITDDVSNLYMKTKGAFHNLQTDFEQFKIHFALAQLEIHHCLFPDKKPNNNQLNRISESFKYHSIFSLPADEMSKYVDELYAKKLTTSTIRQFPNTQVVMPNIKYVFE